MEDENVTPLDDEQKKPENESEENEEKQPEIMEEKQPEKPEEKAEEKPKPSKQPKSKPTDTLPVKANKTDYTGLIVALIALILGAFALWWHNRNAKKEEKTIDTQHTDLDDDGNPYGI